MPTYRLPSDPNLEQLRKQAKTLQRRLRSGDSEAVALARELHPRLAGGAADTPDPAALTRADAQLVVARLYGFPSWSKLRRHVEVVTQYARSPHRQPVGGPIRSQHDLVDEFLRLACLTYDGSIDSQGRWQQARELLAQHPELAAASIHTIAAVGDVAVARALLAEDPAQARLPGGPHDWEPLLYLAYSRIDSSEQGHSTLEVARLLLEHGADPNAGYLWEGLTSPFTALTGCFGRGEGDPPAHQYRLELARLLLEAGADPNDTQTIYNLSWIPGDDWLELLLAYGLGQGSGGPWHARLTPAHPTPAQLLQDALLWATLYDNAERVRLLLRHGVEVDGHGSSHPLMEGQTAYRFAALSGTSEIAEALAAAGADTRLDPVDAFLAACMRVDRPALKAQLAADPTLPTRAVARKPHLILRATELGRRDAVPLLAELGFDVNHLKRLTALHQAAFDGNLELVQLLIELGADPTIEDRSYHATPLGWADHNNQQTVVEYLTNVTPAAPLVDETMVIDGRRYRVTWFDPPFQPRLAQTTQALGICFTPKQQIVLVTLNGTQWNLPGGTIEPGETLEQTLGREVLEEACARVLACRYIGCQRVEELDGDAPAYYQTRFWARVELQPFTREHEMTGRRLVGVNEFLSTLWWGREATARLIIERGLAIEDQLTSAR